MKIQNDQRAQKRVSALVLTALLAVADATLPAYAGELREFQIAALDSATAIHDFASQSDIQILAAADAVAGKRLNAVTGKHSIDEALQLLLAGSGLQHRYMGERAVALVTDAPSSGPTLGPGRDKAVEGVQDGQKRSFWSRFRLAQLDPSGTTSATATSAAEQDPSRRIEEIIVTAQKREQRALDVPISMVAIGGDELQRRKLVSLDDLGVTTPGLSIQSQGGFNRRIMLRGISNVFGNSSLIGLYLDEASVTTSSARQIDLRTHDIERVEVLRGPQGTLYGEGSVGGTIRFISRNPDLQRLSASADGSVSFTEDGSSGQRIESVVNVPVVESVFGLRVAGFVEQGGGWVDQPAAGRSDINDQDLVNVRVKGLWQPTRELTVNAMALYHRNETAPNMGEDEAGNFNQTFNLTTTPYVRDRYDLYNLTLTYDLPALRLLSATSYVDQEKIAYHTAQRGQYVPPPAARFDANYPRNNAAGDVLTEELRLSSTDLDRWTWTVGAFYRRAEQAVESALMVGVQPAPGAPLPAAFPRITSSLSESWAVFGDASYELTNHLTLGAGLRYFEDSQEEASGALALGPTQQARFDSVNPRLYVQYKLTDDFNLYTSAAKGFRSGGFNSLDRPPFDPESVWTYELGTKLSAAHGRVSADLALYYSDYARYQINGLRFVNGTPLTITSNAGNVMIRGVEGSFTFRPVEQWTLSLAGSYVDSQFYRIDTLPGANGAPSSSHVEGDPLDLFPEYTYAISTQRELEIGGKAAYARMDYSVQGRSTYRARNIGPWFFSESAVINMLNASFGLQWTDNVSLTLYGQNLLDDRGYADAFSVEELAARSRPRTYGIGFGVAFD